uniref:Putative resolvase TnpR n=1 Tax=Pseudomonas migulae TaxID=78543 RepID=R4IV18_9PSED|nr:putative resolvase TnpR [Pseudomonas migulae]
MQGQRIGYIRVSSFDQNPERQLEQTEVSKVFTDKASGKDTQRPQLEALLSFVREGDTVVVHSMDRLARNLDDLRRLVQKLTQRGVRIEFLKEGLVFTGEDSPMANLMLSVMGAFAEFERALIRERQREGIALAKQRGAYRGQPCPTSRLLPCGSGRRQANPRPSSPASSTSAGKPSTSTSARTTDLCRVARSSRPLSATPCLRCRKARMT